VKAGSSRQRVLQGEVEGGRAQECGHCREESEGRRQGIGEGRWPAAGRKEPAGAPDPDLGCGRRRTGGGTEWGKASRF